MQLSLPHPQRKGAFLKGICPISHARFFSPLMIAPFSNTAAPTPLPTNKSAIFFSGILFDSAKSAQFKSLSILKTMPYFFSKYSFIFFSFTFIFGAERMIPSFICPANETLTVSIFLCRFNLSSKNGINSLSLLKYSS